MTLQLTIEPGEQEVISLCSGNDSVTDALGHTFAVLHRLAASTVDSYEGDFYHDARWLAHNVGEKGERSFLYSFNESGTSIGIESDVRLRNPEQFYLLQLDHTDSTGRFRGADNWFLHVTRGTF